MEGKYYHSSDINFDSGDLLKANRLEELSKRPKWLRVQEELFENVRKAEFPQRPSRLNSVYLATSLEFTTGRKNIYLVKCEGKIFLTDQNIFSAASNYAKSKKEEIDYARAYWGENPVNRLERPEILVEGKAQIIKKL
ncbi:MAG: DUF2441 domain-containing protein [Candidatus Woesearchaeota archaeon]|jgi:hypothetical protein|nr:DUF2441 domain-containing protein [Candidatus Woesearchaeota archaeon]